MGSVRRITFNADVALIEKARKVACDRGESLSKAFREWLHEFTAENTACQQYDLLMKELRSVNSGGRFSREELNRR